jgi:hypothetical protein
MQYVAATVALMLAVVLGAAGTAAAAQPPFSNADYWTQADRMMTALDAGWNAGDEAYVDRGHKASSRVNSGMLLTHAVAALRGHHGLTRQDARARVLVRRLTARPTWLGAGPVGPHGLSTCWSVDMDRRVPQHASLEPKVAEALAWAWRARRQLDLSAPAVRRIADRVTTCARSPGWRYPTRVVNQINWNAELYASAATVSGDRGFLVRDYRRHLAAFAAGIVHPPPGGLTTNLGRDYEFHYLTRHPAAAGINLDSPEYANIVVQAIGYYDQALRAGMRPLSPAAMRRMRAWVTRLLAGSWTHAGYLNWDTGKGLRRWHSAQYWAFAQQGLTAIATSPRFWAHRAYGRWAKALFDRGLMLYRRLADEDGAALAPPRMFGVRSRMESYECFCARELSNIARAVGLGLGSLPADDPPPLFAYDRDTGRLAVTTPRYSTAIVPDNRGAFRYGGIDPARLFGPGQKVAANVGGRPPAAFGLVVAGADGHRILASQGGRPRGSLRLTHAPGGRRAGRFTTIEARGTVTRGGLRIRSIHRFRRTAIESRWRVRCRGRCGRYRVRAHFPTWGARARIDAILRDGSSVRLAGPGALPGARVRLTDVAALTLGRGYRLIPLTGPPRATLFAVPVGRQRTNPRPGPSLAIELVARGRLRARTLAVRIEPSP